MKDERILIVQKNSNDQKMNVKIRKKVKKGYAPNDYSKVVNPNDFKSLALLFEDLELIIGAPVEKAFREYKSKKEKGFPFY